MPQNYCCIPMCYNKGGHIFPKDQRLRFKWIQSIQNSIQSKNGSNWQPPNKFSLICTAHFTSKDYSHTTKRKKLKCTAVPHVFSGKNYSLVKHKEMCRKRTSRKGVTPYVKKHDWIYQDSEDENFDLLEDIENIQNPDDLMENFPNAEVIVDPMEDEVVESSSEEESIINYEDSEKRDIVESTSIMEEKDLEEEEVRSPNQTDLVSNEKSNISEPESSEDNFCASSSCGIMDGYFEDSLLSMYDMQRTGTLCDFFLCVVPRKGESTEENTIKVHRLVFAAVSKKIRNLKQNTIKLGGSLTSSDLHKIVEFVYTGRIHELGTMSLLDVLRICNVAGALGLVRCVEYLEVSRPDAAESRFERIFTQMPSSDEETAEDSNDSASEKDSFKPPDIDQYLPIMTAESDNHTYEDNETGDYDTKQDINVDRQSDDDTTDTSDDEENQKQRLKRKRKHRIDSESSDIVIVDKNACSNEQKFVQIKNEKENLMVTENKVVPLSPPKLDDEMIVLPEL